MEKSLDFNEIFFGDIKEYNRLIISLLESLRNITPITFWNMDQSESDDLSTTIALEIIDLILESYEKVADNLYSNDLAVHEFPIFLETKEMIECLLMDPFYECDEFFNLAITLSSEFFTLLEIKLLLFDGYSMELEAPQEVLDEYDKELNNFIHRFNNYKDEFTKLHS